MLDVQNVYEDMQIEIESRHKEEDAPQAVVFLASIADLLIDSEEIDDMIPCSYRHETLGMQVNGYFLRRDAEQLDLFIVDYSPELELQNLSPQESKRLLNRVQKFFLRSIAGKHIEQLEPSSEGFDLAQSIFDAKDYLCEVRFYLITNRRCSINTVEEDRVGEIKTSTYICDFNKIYRLQTSGATREDIAIDFRKDFGITISCLKMPIEEEGFCTYLALIPGELLAKIYDKYGSRLLQKNVRSFLQLRGKINSGMRRTILKNPELFLPYNNGLTITVKGIVTEQGLNGLHITGVNDFQIVNGGQTTACIFYTFRKDKCDLKRIAVQAKITQIKDENLAESMTKSIARFANSQNKVSDADLESSNDYLVGLENLSRSIWAPPPKRNKTTQNTKWYFERARGQYDNEKNRQGSRSNILKWQDNYPPGQKITKTDFAKFENSWKQNPHTVSIGGQFNFISYMQDLEEGGVLKPTELDFKYLVAKAILFKEADKIIKMQNYGDYKAQTVTHTIAFLALKTDYRLNLERIWQEQGITPAIENEIINISGIFFNFLLSAARQGRNVSQLCKRENECWIPFRDKYLNYQVNCELKEELILNRQISLQKKNVATEEETEIINAVVANKKMFMGLLRWPGLRMIFDEQEEEDLKRICDKFKYRNLSVEDAKNLNTFLEKAMAKGFRP